MSTPLRVLIVEDSENDTILLVRALRRGGYAPVFERVETPAAMTAALNQQEWDIILSDFAMPSFSAPAALALLKISGIDLPFIIVSGAIGEETAVTAMRAGAHDYVMKGKLARLLPAIERELREAKVRREHRQAEEALRESEEKYRALFEQSTDAIYIASQEGNFIDLNQSALDLFGYTREEMIGLDTKEIYPRPDDWHRFQMKLERDGSARDYEVKLRSKDRTTMDCLVTSTIRRATGGVILGYQGIIRDLTERKRLEQQVQQQDRMAALGELAGGIAHDFNNILMSILLYTEMLLSDPTLPPNLAPDVKSILEEGKEASHLVRQILDFGRRSPMQIRLLNLKDLLQGSIDVLRRTLPASIKLLLEMGSEDCIVKADPTRIRQIAMNLVVNARDAMPGGGELRVTSSRVRIRRDEKSPVPPGEWVCLGISDSGTGIPPEVIPRIFEPFFTTKPKGEGTGLGLAQVYGIVKQHGGHIDVQTEIGQGTTFRVYLPAQEAEEPRKPTPDQSSSSITPHGKGETLLIAEDERRVRESCKRILESLGYRVLVAPNGREALRTYRSTGNIDLVLTDMVMPEMGGKDLIRELRKASPTPKIVVMTGYVLAEDLRELKAEGTLDIVQKPLDVNTLARAIRQALDDS